MYFFLLRSVYYVVCLFSICHMYRPTYFLLIIKYCTQLQVISVSDTLMSDDVLSMKHLTKVSHIMYDCDIVYGSGSKKICFLLGRAHVPCSGSHDY